MSDLTAHPEIYKCNYCHASYSLVVIVYLRFRQACNNKGSVNVLRNIIAPDLHISVLVFKEGLIAAVPIQRGELAVKRGHGCDV